MQRGSGILLHISSLPGKYGIGTMGRSARDFIDRLFISGQKYWQILPVSPTGYGDSPYQGFGVFAGNPYFIDPKLLQEEGLLSKKEIVQYAALFAGAGETVDYSLLYRHNAALLRKAYGGAGEGLKAGLRAFARDNAFWLTGFSLYMAIKASQDLKPWWEWPLALAGRDKKALGAERKRLKEETGYQVFVQYLFFRQWKALKEYANTKGIAVIGDMPFYMARDSADAWANPDILDKEGGMAGCPPDYFSKTGQFWGNPVYDWEALKEKGYDWWVRRARHGAELFDYVRLDHFRGFESYYSVPRGSETAAAGKWIKGPEMGLFYRMKKSLKELPFIAEDLGYLTEPVFELLQKTGFPGLKVLQFAFDPGGDSIYLPHRYDKNCVVYTGTHDNDTVKGYYASLPQAEREFLAGYTGYVNENNVHWRLIRLAMASVADVCIIPMQDVLGLGPEARMNTPQIVFQNWVWRLKEGEFTLSLAKKLKKLAALYGR